MPAPALPLVFLLAPFRGLSFAQRQHVEAVVQTVKTELVQAGSMPVGVSDWADHPLPATTSDTGQEAWKACVRALVLRCDTVVVVSIPGIPEDPLTDWLRGWPPKHAIGVESWSRE